jgi:hypothetical protein
MSADALAQAGISATTIRIAVGSEDPRALLAQVIQAAELALDGVSPGFSKAFMAAAEVDKLYIETYCDVHRRFIESRPKMDECLN